MTGVRQLILGGDAFRMVAAWLDYTVPFWGVLLVFVVAGVALLVWSWVTMRRG